MFEHSKMTGKLKRQLSRVLAVTLSAAMLVTALPADTLGGIASVKAAEETESLDVSDIGTEADLDAQEVYASETDSSSDTNNDQSEPSVDDQSKPANDDQSKPANDDQSKSAADDESKQAGDDQSEPSVDDESKQAGDDQSEPSESEIASQEDDDFIEGGEYSFGLKTEDSLKAIKGLTFDGNFADWGNKHGFKAADGNSALVLNLSREATIIVTACCYGKGNVTCDSAEVTEKDIIAEEPGKDGKEYTIKGAKGETKLTLGAGAYIHGITIIYKAVLDRATPDVWDFGAMEVKGANNLLTVDVINGLYPEGTVAGSAGPNILSFTASDKNDVPAVRFVTTKTNNRIRTTNTKITRFDAKDKKGDDGVTYEGFLYSNSAGTMDTVKDGTLDRLEFYLYEGDKLTCMLGSNGNAANYLLFNPDGEEYAEFDYQAKSGVETAVFYAADEGWYKLYCTNEKLVCARITREHAPEVTVSGKIDTTDAAGIPEGYGVIFTNDITGKASVLTVENGSYTGILYGGYSYTASLKDANGYVINEGRTLDLSKAKDKDDVTNDLVIETVDQCTIVGAVTGLDSAALRNLKLVFDIPEGHVFEPEFTSFNKATGVFRLKVEKGVEYKVTALDVNDFTLITTAVSATETTIADIEFEKKPVYAVTLNYDSDIKNINTDNAQIVFTNIDELYSNGKTSYTYEFSGKDEMNLRTGRYSVKVTGLGKYAVVPGIIPNVNVEDAEASTTVPLKSLETGWDFAVLNDAVNIDTIDGNKYYAGLALTGNVLMNKTYLLGNNGGTITVPNLKEGDNVTISYCYSAAFKLSEGTAEPSGDTIGTASGSTGTIESMVYTMSSDGNLVITCVEDTIKKPVKDKDTGEVTGEEDKTVNQTYFCAIDISSAEDMVEYSSTIQVGTDKAYKTINAALDAVRNMDREEGTAAEKANILNMYKNGYKPEQIAKELDKTTDEINAVISGDNVKNVTIEIDPGDYEEMLVIDMPNITLKNASATPSIDLTNKGVDIDENAVRVTWYYGHGYTYYSMGSDCKYDADLLAANKLNGYASFKNPGSGTTNGSYWNATVTVQASKFRAEGIIFENSFNQYMSKKAVEDVIEPQSGAKEGAKKRADMEYGDTTVQNKAYVERAAALAIYNNQKEIYFDNCKFIGRQDTLYGGSNVTAAFYDCSVYGGTDYIFGPMTAVFAKCDLVFNTSEDSNDVGYITAAQQAKGARGYLMWNCHVTSTQPGVDTASKYTSKAGFFGRPWQANSGEAVFYETIVDATCPQYFKSSPSMIQAIGWNNSLSGESALSQEYNTHEMAYDVYEEKAVDNSKARASWATVLTEAKLTSKKDDKGNAYAGEDAGKDIAVETFLGEWNPFEADGKDMTIDVPDDLGSINNMPVGTVSKMDLEAIDAGVPGKVQLKLTWTALHKSEADKYIITVANKAETESEPLVYEEVENAEQETFEYTIDDIDKGNTYVVGIAAARGTGDDEETGKALEKEIEIKLGNTTTYVLKPTEETALADSANNDKVANGTKLGTDGRFKVVIDDTNLDPAEKSNASVKVRIKDNKKFLQLEKWNSGAIQFEVKGTADVELVMGSTGGGNYSLAALMDSNGKYVKADQVTANISSAPTTNTVTEGVYYAYGQVDKDVIPVPGSTLVYKELPAGKYKIVSPYVTGDAAKDPNGATIGRAAWLVSASVKDTTQVVTEDFIIDVNDFSPFMGGGTTAADFVLPAGSKYGTSDYYKIVTKVVDIKDAPTPRVRTRVGTKVVDGETINIVKSLEMEKWETGGIQFTVRGTANAEFAVCSTGGGNWSVVALKDNNGNYIEAKEVIDSTNTGAFVATKQTDNVYAVYGNEKNVTTLKFENLSAGKYTLVSPYMPADDSLKTGNSQIVDSTGEINGVNRAAWLTYGKVTDTFDQGVEIPRAPWAQVAVPTVSAVQRENTDILDVTVNAVIDTDGADQITVNVYKQADAEDDVVPQADDASMPSESASTGSESASEPSESASTGSESASEPSGSASTGSEPASEPSGSEETPGVVVPSDKDVLVASFVNVSDTVSFTKDFDLSDFGSGKYYAIAVASREDETDHVSAPSNLVDYVLTLKDAKFGIVQNLGGGKVRLEWAPVPEADNYTITVAEDGSKADPQVITTEGKVDGTVLYYTVEKLTVGKTYKFTIVANRGEETSKTPDEAEIKVSAEEQVAWSFVHYGESTSTSTWASTGQPKNGYSENDDGTVTVWSENGAGKIVPASTDGVAFYYTKVPATKNFKLKVKVHADDWIYSNGQDGFGLLATDRLGEGETQYWNNSYMLAFTKCEYYWLEGSVTDSADGSEKINMHIGPGVLEKTGLTQENLANFTQKTEFGYQPEMLQADAVKKWFNTSLTPLETSYAALGAGTYNMVANHNARGYSATKLSVDESFDKNDFTITLEKNNTGYFLSYVALNGRTVTKKFYDTKALENLDKDYVYVGMFASRNARATFSNIEFSTIDPEDDAPAETKPITSYTPSFNVTSASVANSPEYEFKFAANWAGKLTVKDATGKLIIDNVKLPYYSDGGKALGLGGDEPASDEPASDEPASDEPAASESASSESAAQKSLAAVAANEGSDSAVDSSEQGTESSDPVVEEPKLVVYAPTTYKLSDAETAAGYTLVTTISNKTSGTENGKDITLNVGDNLFSVIYTPDKNWHPENDELNVLSDYSTSNFTHTVTYKAYGEEGKALYVAPWGKSSGTGKKNNPLDIYTAIKYVQAGQSIILEGGRYSMTSPIRVERGINGTEDKMIYMIANPESDERPVFDFNGISTGMTFGGDYWYLQGFDVTRSKDGQKGIQVSGSHNVLDGINTYMNGNTGIQIARLYGSDTFNDWPAYNLVLNCNSYLNSDAGFEDADGFAAKLTVGEGNVFDGCVAAYNADDGWDLFAKVETGSIGKVTIQNSVTYKNGYVLVDDEGKLSLTGKKEVVAGNGNGFKMGGESLSGFHTLKNSYAFYNRAKGFDSNSCPDIQIENSISFNNESYNIAFYTNVNPQTNFGAKGVISYKTDDFYRAHTVSVETPSEASSEESSEVASDAASEAGSDAASEAASDAASEAGSDAASEVASDTASEAASGSASDAASEAASDANTSSLTANAVNADEAETETAVTGKEKVVTTVRPIETIGPQGNQTKQSWLIATDNLKSKDFIDKYNKLSDYAKGKFAKASSKWSDIDKSDSKFTADDNAFVAAAKDFTDLEKEICIRFMPGIALFGTEYYAAGADQATLEAELKAQPYQIFGDHNYYIFGDSEALYQFHDGAKAGDAMGAVTHNLHLVDGKYQNTVVDDSWFKNLTVSDEDLMYFGFDDSDKGVVGRKADGTLYMKHDFLQLTDKAKEADSTMDDVHMGEGQPSVKPAEDPNIPKDETSGSVIGGVGEENTSGVVMGDEPVNVDTMEGLWFAYVNAPEEGFTYTGTAIRPEIRVYYDTTRLKKSDYSVSYVNTVNAFTWDAYEKLTTDKEKEACLRRAPAIKITGKGNYEGFINYTFEINPVDIDSNLVAKPIISKLASGRAQKLVPVMTYNGRKLANKRDFTYEEKTFSAAGMYEGENGIKVKGVGNYTGETTINVNLVDKSNTSMIDINKAKITMNSNSIFLFTKSYIYCGEEIKPGVTAMYTDPKTRVQRKLVEGEDYTVTYTNNVNVGTASIVIEGLCNTDESGKLSGFYGSKTLNFKIKPANVKNLVLNSEQYSQAASKVTVYKGQPVMFTDLEIYMLASDGEVDKPVYLTEGTDYTLTYSGNSKAGNASFTIKGKGNYTGTLKKTFKISAYDIALDEEELIGGNIVDDEPISIAYAVGGAKPEVSVTLDGLVLKAGRDYTVSYRGNTRVTDKTPAMITVTGKGGLKGRITKYFTVTPKAMDDDELPLSMEANDIVAKPKGAAPKTIVRVYSSTKRIVPASEYDLTYYDETGKDVTKDKSFNPKAGDTVTVRATAKARSKNFIPGTYIETEVNVAAVDLRSVKVRPFDPMYYTGLPVTLSENDFDYIDPKTGVRSSRITYKKGKEVKELQFGVDFEVVPGSYENNIKAGTARFTIRGITSEFCGTRVLTFRINKKCFNVAKGVYTIDKSQSNVEDQIVVRLNNVILKKDEDYVVDTSKYAAKKTVIIKGIGGYGGIKTVNVSKLLPEPTDD